MRNLLIIFMMISNFTFSQAVVSVDEENSHSHAGTGVVFSGFPVHEEDYAEDVRAIATEAIYKYGVEEWRLVVLTSEMHGHLGIYAIIGAKMGLYAREILQAGHDELVISSLAGSKPPVSCMNDGLQVSTGATLGHGLISVKQVDKPITSAEFSYKGTTVTLSLNKPLQNEIDSIIKDAIISSGGLTEQYWQKVREAALVVWLKYDRKEIFDVIE
jgi:pyrimidine-specific ribonucleoside hydrolase